MFDKDFSLYGIHANYLKDLCELRANVPDREQHNNFKIFQAYIDAYILCPLIGYQYSRRIPMGSASDGEAGILLDAITKRKNELKYVYQTLMLIDEESEPDPDKRVFRAFKLSEDTDEGKQMIAENMKIYNEYFIGGIDVLHKEFVEQCLDEDSYIRKIYEFTKSFYEEQDGDALKASIDKFINQ